MIAADVPNILWLIYAILWGFYLSWITFAVTLTVNKSKLFGAKKEFVKQRYEAAFVNGSTPGKIHWFWHAMWTCAMCLGFWVALGYGLKYRIPFGSVLMAYGLNWLYHCIEDRLTKKNENFTGLAPEEEKTQCIIPASSELLDEDALPTALL